MDLIVFCAASLLIVYTCAAFPLILLARAYLFQTPYVTGDAPPDVSVIVAAYNEAGNIEGRIENLLSLDYPPERLEVIVASDGSSDATLQIVERYAGRGVVALSLPRQGKGHTLNAAVQAARGAILVFTDANIVFCEDALRALVAPLADDTVGGVVGNQVYLRDGSASPTADGERMHWSCDRRLKEWQSRAGSVTSATGSIYAVRRSLFQSIPADVMDDFFVSTGVVAQNHRLVMALDAVALEPVATKPGAEFSRKLRIISQGLQGVLARRELLNPFRHGFYSLQLLTHKVLRRLVVIPALMLLPTSISLWSTHAIFRLATATQLGFYGLAILGWSLRRTSWMRFKLFSLPYFLCMVNAAALIAFWRVLRGCKIRSWEPERHSSSRLQHSDQSIRPNHADKEPFRSPA